MRQIRVVVHVYGKQIFFKQELEMAYTSQTGHRKGMDYCGSHQKSGNLIIKEMEHTSLRRNQHITLACPRDDENCPMGKKLLASV